MPASRISSLSRKASFSVARSRPKTMCERYRRLAQLVQDVLKNGQVLRIRVFAGQQRDDQNALLPAGVQPEVRSQPRPILVQDVKGRGAGAGL